MKKEVKKERSDLKREASVEDDRPVKSIKAEKRTASPAIKKRTRKQAKMARCDFLDFEADVSDEEEYEPRKDSDEYARGKYHLKELFRIACLLSSLLLF